MKKILLKFKRTGANDLARALYDMLCHVRTRIGLTLPSRTMTLLGAVVSFNAITVGEDVVVRSMHPDPVEGDHHVGYMFSVPDDAPLTDHLTVRGKLGDISAPSGGLTGNFYTLQELMDAGRMQFEGSVDPSDFNLYYRWLNQASQNQTITVPYSDPGLGTFSVDVFSSSSLATLTAERLGSYGVYVFDPQGCSDTIYVEMGIAETTSTGGLITVELGDMSENITHKDNTLSIAAKDSILFQADGTADEEALVEWIGINYIDFQITPTIAEQKQQASLTLVQFDGTINETEYYLDGDTGNVLTRPVSFTITSPADIGAYNDWLLDQFQYWVYPVNNGGLGLSPSGVNSDYNSKIAHALSLKTTEEVSWVYNVWEDGEDYTGSTATASNTYLNAIYATGEDAEGVIRYAAHLAVAGSRKGAMRADDSANIEIEYGGRLDVWRQGIGTDVSIGMYMEYASGTNYGIINSGIFMDSQGERQDINNYGSYGMYGIDSAVVNFGIINQALTTDEWGAPNGKSDGIDAEESDSGNEILAKAMWLRGDSTGHSDGIINIVNRSDGSGDGTAYGIVISDDSEFIHYGTGLIYIGREAQWYEGQDSNDVVMSGGINLTAGMYIGNTTDNSWVTNEGTITIGSLTRNAAGIMFVNSDGHLLNGSLSQPNDGTIIINGGLVEGSGNRMNYGITVRNSLDAQNYGNIIVNGANNVGLHVLSASSDAYLASRGGTITVNGADFASSGYRNYAIHAEGGEDNSLEALIDIESKIVLNGAGSIGVFVQNNALVNLNIEGSPVINNTDQIAFYLTGYGARVNILDANFSDDGHARTTLFRIAEGAEYTGTNKEVGGDPLDLIVNGKNSVAVIGTGRNATVRTGSSIISVGGDNSTAIIIEGGAIGYIDATTDIRLLADNTTAAKVDGQQHNLAGNNTGSTIVTNLYSSAEVSSFDGTLDHSGVTAYVAQSKGHLYLQDSAIVSLTGGSSIGIDLKGGGNFTNNAATPVYVKGGVGVRVEGSDAKINKLGVIEVEGQNEDFAQAGVYLYKGARMSITGEGGKILTNGFADGILLENANGYLAAEGFLIDILGVAGSTDDSSSAGIQNKSELSQVYLNDVTINVRAGNAIRTATSFSSSLDVTLNVMGNGRGFSFESYLGAQVASDLTISSAYTINVGASGDDGVALGTAVYANTTGKVAHGGVINIYDKQGVSAIWAPMAASIANTGTVVSYSTSGTSALIDGSGSNGKTITNSGILRAATDSHVAILAGSGNDTITFSDNSQTVGVINTGTGSDTFIWNKGSFAGEVNYSGTVGNNIARIGDVDVTAVRHILTNSGEGNSISFDATGVTAGAGSVSIGSFSADASSDDLTKGLNIGTGWETLTVSNQADIRITDKLVLNSSAPQVVINSGAIVRSGNYEGTDPNRMTIGNYNVVINGDQSKLYFDNTGTSPYTGIISGDGQFYRTGDGKTIFLSDNTYTGQTSIEDGGILQLGTGGTSGVISSYSNILNDGTLIINRSDRVVIGNSSLGRAATLSSITGTGSLYQSGSGTTVLAGANSYTGITEVEAGMLLVNGNQSAATGKTTVYSQASLGGYGTIGGNVEMKTNTVLTPGDEGAGTLTINGDLILTSSTHSAFEFGLAYTPGGAFNDMVTVAGDLVLDGILDISTSENGYFGPGVYRVFNYGGEFTNNTLELGEMPDTMDRDLVIVQTTIANQVNLINLSGLMLQFWDGDEVGQSHGASGWEGDGIIQGGDGTWYGTSSPDGAAPYNNWTTALGDENAIWSPKAFAIFQAEGGTVTVDNETYGVVVTAGAQFAADGYLITGDDLFAVATNTNEDLDPAYPGQTPNNGEFILNVGAGAAGADYTATIESNINERDADDSLQLVKVGPGRLILSGTNTYKGGTRIDGGILQVSTDENLGLGGTEVIINYNSVLQMGDDLVTDRDIVLGEGGGTFDLNSFDFTPEGDITGDGKLTVTSSSDDDLGTLYLARENSYTSDTDVIGTGDDYTVRVQASVTGAFGSNRESTITITERGMVEFTEEAGAEQHTFDIVNGLLALKGESTGDEALVNVEDDGIFSLEENSNAGSSITQNNGLVQFAGEAMAENAIIYNNEDALVRIDEVDSTTSIGSLSGAGNVELGEKSLYLGNLGYDDVISGIISGEDGDLFKTGPGTLELLGDNTYTGYTDVLSGVLLVNGDQSEATGDVTVRTGATLGGSGIMGGDVTVENGGHLAAGATIGAVGTFTMGALNLNEDSQLDFQLGRAFEWGGALNDLLNVNGDLVLDGKLNITVSPEGQFLAGIYRLINYTGELTNNILDIADGAPAAADELYVQTSIKNQVNLVNTAGLVLRFWDGYGGVDGVDKNNSVIDGGDGIWQNSKGNDNWTQDDPIEGFINAPFEDNAFAVFMGEPGTVTVDNSKGAVMISGAQFAVDGYVVLGEKITTHTADTQIRVGDGTENGADMTTVIHSELTGTGGIHKADLGTLVLTSENTYSGGTRISGGTLVVSSDGNLGASGTGLVFDGGVLRYADGFDTDRQVTIESGGGGVDTNGFDVAFMSSLKGDGTLYKMGEGTLFIMEECEFTGNTVIEGGIIQLGDGGETGCLHGDIHNNGVLMTARSNELDIADNISGTGSFSHIGSGTTIFSGANTYSGLTNVTNGTLRANGINTLSAASSHIVYSGGRLETMGNDQVIGGLANAGAVSLTGGGAGTELRVKGNYIGMGGTLELNVNPEAGIADRLVIDGRIDEASPVARAMAYAADTVVATVEPVALVTATGQTLIVVNPVGLGAQTTGDGIEVVTAENGATTTAQDTQDAFTLGADYIFVGAYAYGLYAGDAEGLGENWYLRSELSSDFMLFNALPNVLRNSDRAMLGTLHQRMGDEYKESFALVDDSRPFRAWTRAISSFKTIKTKGDSVTKSDNDTYGFQIGSDVYSKTQWKTGVYFGFLDNRADVHGYYNDFSGNAGRIKTESYYVGAYGTYMADFGLYVDTVLQYGRHDSRIEPGRYTGNKSDVNSNSWLASVEVGQTIDLGDKRWFFEPQAQLFIDYNDIQSSTLHGAHVSQSGSGALVGRLGARFIGVIDTPHGRVMPYLRGNLWHGFAGGDDKVSIEGVDNAFRSRKGYTHPEVSIGCTWDINDRVSIYGEAGHEFNAGPSFITGASVGVKVSF